MFKDKIVPRVRWADTPQKMICPVANDLYQRPLHQSKQHNYFPMCLEDCIHVDRPKYKHGREQTTLPNQEPYVVAGSVLINLHDNSWCCQCQESTTHNQTIIIVMIWVTTPKVARLFAIFSDLPFGVAPHGYPQSEPRPKPIKSSLRRILTRGFWKHGDGKSCHLQVIMMN